MPNPNDNSQPPAAWCYSGNQIKRWRTLANVSREALATAANYAPETISSMERGVRMPSPRLLDIADELCGAQGMLSAAKEYVRRERYSARAVDFIEREREATSLWTYEVALVPGLLQTRGPTRRRSSTTAFHPWTRRRWKSGSRPEWSDRRSSPTGSHRWG
ncbi:transcriptional regulator with XRE-family HTH domain [Streptomyces ambofaciens]